MREELVRRLDALHALAQFLRDDKVQAHKPLIRRLKRLSSGPPTARICRRCEREYAERLRWRERERAKRDASDRVTADIKDVGAAAELLVTALTEYTAEHAPDNRALRLRALDALAKLSPTRGAIVRDLVSGRWPWMKLGQAPVGDADAAHCMIVPGESLATELPLGCLEPAHPGCVPGLGYHRCGTGQQLTKEAAT